MADQDYRRPQAIESHEIDLKTVQVILSVDGLQGSKKNAKNATVEHHFDERSFQITADVENKDKGKGVTKYKQVIRKLPGPIVPEECDVKYDDGKIILTLVKPDDFSWEVYLRKNNLEQDVEDSD